MSVPWSVLEPGRIFFARDFPDPDGNRKPRPVLILVASQNDELIIAAGIGTNRSPQGPYCVTIRGKSGGDPATGLTQDSHVCAYWTAEVPRADLSRVIGCEHARCPSLVFDQFLRLIHEYSAEPPQGDC